MNYTFCFSKDNSSEGSHKNLSFMHLTNAYIYEFTNHVQVCDKDKIRQLQDEFSVHLSEWQNEWEIFIPLKYLDSVSLNQSQLSDLINSKYWDEFIEEICNCRKLILDFNFSNYFQNIEEYASLQYY